MDLSTEDLERAARALLDNRMDSVRALVTGRQRVTELREHLAEAEREDARNYTSAVRDGWTADELKKLGLAEPDKRPKTRRRGAAAAAKSAGNGTASGGSDDGDDGADNGTV